MRTNLYLPETGIRTQILSAMRQQYFYLVEK